MLLADAQESDRLEREALERAVSTVEGIVLGSTRMSDSAIRMIAKQRPMIVLNRAMPDVPSVVTDNARGMRRAVEHLAELGHHEITYVAGPEQSWPDGLRWRSVREAAHDGARPALPPDRPAPADRRRRNRRGRRVRRAPDVGRDRLQRPDGDRVHPRSRGRGIRVPEDVSVSASTTSSPPSWSPRR